MDLGASLGQLLESILESDWLRQIAILMSAWLVTWPLSKALVQWQRRSARPGREAQRELRILRDLIRVSVWPVLAMGLTAAGLELWRRVHPAFARDPGRILPILGFFLLYRLVDQLLQEFVVAGSRRRHLRRGVVPALFLLAVLQQLGLLGPILDIMQRPLLRLGSVPLTLLSVLSAVLVLMGSTLAGRLLAHLLGHRFLGGFGLERGLSEAIGTIARYVLVVIGLLWALEILGFDLTTVKIAFGALGVGIGFGLQTIVNNFTSGLILLFERSVKRGDVLTVDGTDGRVESIGLRASVLRSREGDDLILPNSSLVSNRVTNYSFRDRLKLVCVDVGVSYLSDPHQVRDLLLKVAENCDDVLSYPKTTVLFTDFGASSLDFQLRCWIDDAWKLPQVRSHLLFDIWHALKEAGIEIPYPQRDLHLRSGELPVRRVEEAEG